MKWGERKSHCIHVVVSKKYPYAFECTKLHGKHEVYDSVWSRCMRCMWREKPEGDSDA